MSYSQEPRYTCYLPSQEDIRKANAAREQEEWLEKMKYPYGRPQWARDIDAKLDRILSLLQKSTDGN